MVESTLKLPECFCLYGLSKQEQCLRHVFFFTTFCTSGESVSFHQHVFLCYSHSSEGVECYPVCLQRSGSLSIQ